MELGYLPWTWPAAWADRPCLRDEHVELSYTQVAQRVDAFAGQLAERGVQRGDVIAVMLPNRVELLVALMAAWRLGAAATPLNPVFTATEADDQLADSGAVLVLTEGPDAPTAGLPSVEVADMRASVPTAALPGVATRGDDLALLIYTSGSTGTPKGVMLDHANLQAMGAMMADHFRLTADDHCLLVLPLFHVNAICNSFLAPLMRGAQSTILRRFSPLPFLAAVEEHRPTYFSAVPTIYARLAELPAHVRPDTSSLRFAVCGAAPVSQELLERSEQRFGFVVVEGYGLTEATCASTCNPVEGLRKLGTVGPALAGQRISVIGEDGQLLPVGEVGQVVISGPNVMGGYLNGPDATAETLVDGWLRTGDVGRVDEDGHLVLVDRMKDMIIRGGENIYPKQIESVLSTHPAVLEAAVVGAPDPVYGEVPVAFVVTYPDATATPDELRDHLRPHLTKVKIPVSVSIVDALPKNPVGKIDKPVLRRQLQSRLVAAD